MAELKWETPKRDPKGSMYDNLNSLRDTAETAINELKKAKAEMQKKYDEELERLQQEEKENGEMETTETR
jgi:hypothetical protein